MNIRHYQRYLFAALSLVYMLPFIQGVIMTVVAKDVMRDLGLGPKQMGVLGASFLVSYAASMFLSGMMAAYFGPRRLLTGMFLVAGIGGLMFAHAPSLLIACIGRALSGIGTAVCLSASFTLFARWYRAESYSRICGLFFSIGGMGAFLGAAPLAMVNVEWGWRSCFLLVAVLTLCYSALVFFTVRDWPPAGSEGELGITPAPRDRVTLAAIRDSVAKVSKSLDFWRLSLWFIGVACVYQSFVGLWAVPYFKDVFGLSDARAGIVLSMFSLGFIIGNPALAWFCEKKLKSNRIALGAAGIVGLLATLPFYLFGHLLGYASLILVALAMGMAINAPNTLIYASNRNIFGSRQAGMTSGVMAGCSLISGATMQVISSSLLSFALDRAYPVQTAYLVAFSPFILCYLLSTVCGFTLTRASDPGHVSPMSWRVILKKSPEDTRDAS